MTRWLSLLALPLLLLFSVERAAPRGRDVSPEEKLGKEVAELRRGLAEKHRKLAKWCQKQRLRRTAHRHMLLAMHFGPDVRSVRTDMGYRKIDGVWVRRKPIDLSKLADAAEPGIEYRVRDDEIRAGRVKSLVLIAEEARKLELEDQARALLEEALRISPQDDVVRKSLGHVRVGPRWFSPEEARCVPTEVEIEKIAEPSELSQALGVQMIAFRSGRWRFESKGAEQEFRMVLEAVVRADGLASWMLTGEPGTSGSSVREYYDLGNPGAFDRYVDEMSGLPPDRAAAAKGETGLSRTPPRWVRRTALADHAPEVADWMAHQAGKSWIGRKVGRPKAWALIGFTHYLSERVVGTAKMRFFKLEQSSGLRWAGAEPDPDLWRRELRDLVLLEEDPPAGPLFSTALTGMTGPDAMKAWSLIGFLVQRDREAFSRFFYEAAKGDRTIEALKEHFGWTPEELDGAWRAWIVENG